jgi:RNA recognition motif-containing protein
MAELMQQQIKQPQGLREGLGSTLIDPKNKKNSNHMPIPKVFPYYPIPASSITSHIPRALLVRNLHFSTDPYQIQQMFSPFGKLLEARLVENIDSGEPTGCAVVRFMNKENGLKALHAFDGRMVKGRV